MKKVLSIVITAVMIASLVGCSNSNNNSSEYVAPAGAKESSESEGVTEASTENDSTIVVSTEEYSITYRNSGSLDSHAFNNDGIAWATITKEKTNETKLALINTNREIIYFQDMDLFNNSCNTTPFFNGISAVYPTNINGNPSSGFIIVDKTGKEVFSYIDEDMVLCGDDNEGCFYVAKHDSGFDHDNWSLGTVDSQGYKDLEIIVPEIASQYYNETIKLKDGLVYFCDSCSYLNLNTKSWIEDGPTLLGVHGNYAIIDSYMIPIETLSNISKADDIRAALKSDSTLRVDGKDGFLESNENISIDKWYYSSWNNGSFYRKYWRTENGVNKELHYDYVDTNGKVIFEYPRFADGIKYLKIDDFSGNYSAVYIKGVDGKRYVTLVDDKGQQQYEPVELECGLSDEDTSCSCNGYIFAYSINDRQIEIISPDGMHLNLGDNMPELKGGSCIYKERFSLAIGGNYMFVNKNDGNYKYYSIDGNQSFDKVSANFNSKKELVYTDPTGVKVTNTLSSNNYVSSTQESVTSTEKTDNEKTYTNTDKFDIKGKWKNIGKYTYGQAQKGSIISFDGTNCNFYSPKDTYAFYKKGDNYRLDCTSPLGDTASFTVKIVDDEHIDVSNGSDIVELKRIS